MALERCLDHFFNLFDLVKAFLENRDNELCRNLIASKIDITYLANQFKIFNDVNLQLQGGKLNLMKIKSVIVYFRSQYCNFPTLSALSGKHEDLLTYCQHLDALHADFTGYFKYEVSKLDLRSFCIHRYSRISKFRGRTYRTHD